MARRPKKDAQLGLPWHDIVTPAPTKLDVPHAKWSLARVRRWIRERVPEGCHCPACGGHAKVYKRSLRTGWTYALALMATAPLKALDGAGYLHVTSYINSVGKGTAAASGVAIAGDWQLMRHWRLIESGEGLGMWRITDAGVAFLARTLTVPGGCLLYNNELVGFTPDHIRIDQASGETFDLDAIMAPARLDPPIP